VTADGGRRRPLKVGVQLPEIERVAPWADLAAMARRAEDLGFDSVWVGDHLLYRTPGEPPKAPWEAWSLLAALAAVTERVELGPLVACTSFHNPAMLAKKAETVDEISGGRLILGLGAGWNEPEYRAFGYPFDHRASRFEEAFTVIRTLLATGEVDYHGRYYEAEDCLLLPRGPRPGGIPLMVGSQGERVLRATLPHVRAWNTWYAWYGNRPDGLVPLLARIDALCRDVGRDPATLEKTVAVLVQLPGGEGRAGGDVADRGAPPLSGAPDEIAGVLRSFAQAGVAHVQIVPDPNTVAGLEAFAPVLAVLDQG
jgi:probable F420-dependent oxidoreductase